MQALVWDMRRGFGAPSLGAQGLQYCGLLQQLNIEQALSAVPRLTDETHVPTNAIDGLLLDPDDPRSAAFHMTCGWSGETPTQDLVRPHASDVGFNTDDLHLRSIQVGWT